MRWLELERFCYSPFGTFGRLFVWDRAALRVPGLDPDVEVFSCFTVEPEWEGNAVGRSCIPIGKYPIVFEYSPKFKRELWELKEVPGRAEAKLHVANRASELEGCIAPGLRLGAVDEMWAVKASAVALERIHKALSAQKASYLIIRNAPEQGVLERAVAA